MKQTSLVVVKVEQLNEGRHVRVTAAESLTAAMVQHETTVATMPFTMYSKMGAPREGERILFGQLLH
jgi:hypothetical protein